MDSLLSGKISLALTLRVAAIFATLAVIGLMIFLSVRYNLFKAVSDLFPKQGSTLSMTITDWRVRFNLTDDLNSLLSSKPLIFNDYQKVLIVDSDLDTTWTCDADNNGVKGNIGYITREDVNGPDLSAAGVAAQASVTTGGNKYIYWAAPTQSCTTSDKYPLLVSSFAASFKKLKRF